MFSELELDKITEASNAYHEDAKSRGKQGFNYELWEKYAQLLVLFDEYVTERVSSKERYEMIQAYMGAARSTARRHLQIAKRLHLIKDPEQYQSWGKLHEAAVSISD